MLDVEHLEKSRDDLLLELLFGDPSRELARALDVEREPESLLYGQRWVMDVVLLVINCLSAVRNELLVGEGAVQHLASHARVAVPLVRDGSKERGAAGPGFTKHEDHLTRFAYALELVQEGSLGPLLAKTEQSPDWSDDVEEVDERIGKGFDVVRLSAHALHREPGPVHADVLRTDPGFPLGVQVTAQHGLQIELLQSPLRGGQPILQLAFLVVSLVAPVAGAGHVGQLALQLGKVGLCLSDRDASRPGRSLGVGPQSLFPEILGVPSRRRGRRPGLGRGADLPGCGLGARFLQICIHHGGLVVFAMAFAGSCWGRCVVMFGGVRMRRLGWTNESQESRI